MRKLLLIDLSPATRAVIGAALVIFLVASALVGDYAVATWRANQAVSRSESSLCTVISLAIATPVPRPPATGATPAQETTYRWYVAFTQVAREYHCTGR